MVSLHISTTKRGFSLLELLIAFAVLTLILVFNLSLWYFNQNSYVVGKEREFLLPKAISILGQTATTSLSQFDLIVASSSSEGNLFSNVEVNVVDQFRKEVVAKVSATTSFAGIRASVELKEIFFDHSRVGEQSTCLARFQKDWARPLFLDSISFSTSSIATSIKTQKGLAYVSANSALQSDPDLYIFDISDSSDMKLLSSIDTGPGVSALALSWPYLYLANMSINAQLQVVDINDPGKPVLKNSFKLPGGWRDVGYVGYSVSLYKNMVVLGTRKSDGPEIHIIDITDRLNPRELGTFELNSTVNRFVLTEDTLFVASPLDTELIILDIQDPTLIAQIASYNAPGGSGNGKSFFYAHPYLYLGRTIGGKELVTLNVSDPANPTDLGSVKIGSSIENILVREPYIFLATIDAAKQFQVWSVKDHLPQSFQSSVVLSSRTVDFDCDQESIFVITQADPGLYSISGS